MYYSGVSRSRKVNQQLSIMTDAAIPKNRLRRVSSDPSPFFGSEISLDSFDEEWNSFSKISFSNPCTPKASESSKNSVLENKGKTKVGLGFISLLADDEEAETEPFDKTIIPFPKKNMLLSDHEVKVEQNVNLNASFRIITTPDYPIEFGSRERALGGGGGLLHDWPCVFESTIEPASPPRVDFASLIVAPNSVAASECQGHAIISPEGNYACFPPLTFCSVHKNAGLLRLEDIEHSESYTRVEVNLPLISKVTHRFDDCVLEFPPNHENLIVFKGNKEDSDGVLFGSDPPPKPPKVEKPSRSSSRFRLRGKFLTNCLDCGKPLAGADVYIYRGDSAFCSEDCRYFNAREEIWDDFLALAYANAGVEQGAVKAKVAENLNPQGRYFIF